VRKFVHDLRSFSDVVMDQLLKNRKPVSNGNKTDRLLIDVSVWRYHARPAMSGDTRIDRGPGQS